MGARLKELVSARSAQQTLDRKNPLLTRNVKLIDLQSVYTILGRCTTLYIYVANILNSLHIDRHGTIMLSDSKII